MKIGDKLYCIRDYYDDTRYGMGNISIPSTYTKGGFYKIQFIYENTILIENDQNNNNLFAKNNGYFLTKNQLRNLKLKKINEISIM